MRPSLAAALALVSACLGVLVGRATVVPAATPLDPHTTAVPQWSVEGIERELAEINRSLGRLVAAGGGTERLPRPAEPGAELSESPTREGASVAARSQLEPDLPPVARDRVLDISKWRQDAAVRQSWMFAGERTMLDVLGTPSRVYTAQGTQNEYWVYEDQETVTLTFRNGRLLDVQSVPAPR